MTPQTTWEIERIIRYGCPSAITFCIVDICLRNARIEDIRNRGVGVVLCPLSDYLFFDDIGAVQSLHIGRQASLPPTLSDCAGEVDFLRCLLSREISGYYLSPHACLGRAIWSRP